MDKPRATTGKFHLWLGPYDIACVLLVKIWASFDRLILTHANMMLFPAPINVGHRYHVF
jgi:hypothetical protein